MEIRSAGSFLEELVCFLPVITLLATILCIFIPNFYVLGHFCLNPMQKKKKIPLKLALYEATRTYKDLKCSLNKFG